MPIESCRMLHLCLWRQPETVGLPNIQYGDGGGGGGGALGKVTRSSTTCAVFFHSSIFQVPVEILDEVETVLAEWG